MIINFDKKDLILETRGPVSAGTGFAVCREAGITSPCSYLNFEGFAGFNEKYVVPLLQVIRNQVSKRDGNLYRVLKVTGNLHNDDAMHSADFYILKNVRDTAFLFKTLKSFTISLPDLRLGYYEDPSTGLITLYLDKKIIKVIKDLGEDNAKEIVLYFCCLAKFFNAFNMVNPSLGTDATSGNIVFMETDLNALYIAYGGIPEKFSVECLQLKEDVCFKSVLYTHNTYIPFVKETVATKYASTFAYNVIKSSVNKFLCIINVTLKEFYLIDNKDGIVYTNNILKEYNTFDMNEWMPTLIVNLASLVPNKDVYKLVNIPLDKLLHSKSVEVVISNDASDYEALLEMYPSITENTSLKLYDGYFVGSKLISEGGVTNLSDQYTTDAYAQELYKQIQPYYETFDLKDLTGIVKGVAKGDVYAMLFEGESGTGKSTAARVIASRCGIPFIAINCSTNIEESDMIGTFIPNPKKSKPDDPEFVWRDGQLTMAVRHGYCAIIEEIGGARPGILMKFNSLLDEARQLDLPNGEVLKAHPNFRMIATTNVGYEGTNRLNKALVNRFDVCKKFVDLSESEARKIIMERTGYTNADKINKVLDVYKNIKKYSEEYNLSLVVSIRQLLKIFTQGKYYKNAKEAVYCLMLYQAFLEEPEHLKSFTETMLDNFDLSFKL